MPDSSTNNLVLGGLAACAVGLVSIGILYTFFRKSRRNYQPVGVVSCIYVHPVKSCRGMSVSRAEFAALGLTADGIMDRSFMILDPDGNFVTQRKYPSLALVAVSLSDDLQSLVFNAPGMPSFSLPLKSEDGAFLVPSRVWTHSVQGEYCGDEIREWLSKYLGSPGFLLVRHTAKAMPRKLCKDATWGDKHKRNEQSAYQDFSAVSIAGTASLDSLNSKMDKPVTMRNFRPNIVVESTTPFDEDKWKYVRIGEDAILRTTHRCGRCRFTTIDPDAGKFYESGDPIKTLKKFRLIGPEDPDGKRHGPSPCFATNLAVEQPGTFKLGDVVYASRE